MEKSFRLSEQALDRIKEHIESRTTYEELTQEEEICIEATEKILEKETDNYKNGLGLTLQDIIKLPPDVLSTNVKKKLYPEFKSLGSRRLSPNKINDLIRQVEGEGIRAAGVSEATLRRFLRREKVEEKAFINFCFVLGQRSWENCVEQPLDPLLESTLLKLNHQVQRQQFVSHSENCWCNEPLLIQYSFPDMLRLQWLLRYLTALNPSFSKVEFVFIDLTSTFRNLDIYSLWSNIQYRFGSPNDRDEIQIAKKLAKKLQRNHIILIFAGVDNVGEDYLINVMEQFWRPLIKTVRKVQPLTEYRLLMCWVDQKRKDNDWRGSVDKWCSPCKLSAVDYFTTDDLNTWLDEPSVTDVVKLRFGDNLDSSIQQIRHQTQDGKPESVFQALYGDRDWKKKVSSWQRF